MDQVIAPLGPGAQKLAANIMHFVRLLRRAGLPIGPGKLIDAVRAVEAVGVGRRDDFYWALHATLVMRRDQHPVFDEAFRLFWRNPASVEDALALLLPKVERTPVKPPPNRRVTEALWNRPPPTRQKAPTRGPLELDMRLTYSDSEHLRHKDFEQMTASEVAQAKRLIAQFRLPVRDLPTRRFCPDPRGTHVDMRATLRASLRGGGGIVLQRRRARRRPPALVAICDISGSMTTYSRILLHFFHALTNDRDRVYSFVFGTRLTNITRQLRFRDVDVALAKASEAAADWSGGTRIGYCLDQFNRRWSRRVLGQGAVVLLITDGLDRDLGDGLSRTMERLHKSCRQLIWLNPLLRYEGFEAKAAGIKAMLPHIDDFRSAHNVESLADLVRALSARS